MDERVAEAERVFVEFLRAQLALCFSFADLVKTGLIIGGRGAESVIKKAEDGYANVARFLPRVQSAHLRHELTVRLAGLRMRLDGERRILQNRLNAKPQRHNGCMVQGKDYPIVGHSDAEKTDCCGCLYLDDRGEQADIVCNECGCVIRTVPKDQAVATIAAMASREICSAACIHCGALNVFPGWSAIEAFICRECGEGVVIDQSVQ